MDFVYLLLYIVLYIGSLILPFLIVMFGPEKFLTKIGKESKNSTVNLSFAIFGAVIFFPYIEFLYGAYLVNNNIFFFLIPLVLLAIAIVYSFVSYAKLKGKEDRFFLAINDQVNNHKNYEIESMLLKNAFIGNPPLTHIFNTDIEYLLRVGKRKAIIPESVKIVDGENIYQ